MQKLRRRYGLGNRSWRELDSIQEPIAVLVPIGACEQHGPHLPLATDTHLATAIAYLCCPILDPGWRPLVAPAIAITASGEHHGFAGTLSIGVEATTATLLELARSADWADRLVFVNGHGGNTAAARAAVERCRADGRTHVSVWAPKVDQVADADGDLHAGWIETSAMLHLHPELVDRARFEPGPPSIDVTALLSDGVAAVSPNGVLGDPQGATAARGRELVDRWVLDLADHIGPPTSGRPASARRDPGHRDPDYRDPGRQSRVAGQPGR